MKKKGLILFMCSILALAGACKSGTTSGLKASDYVTLGKYKGIEVTVDRVEITDELVEMAIEDHRKSNATVEEVTGRAVMKGDIVNIDFVGMMDGVAFDGGSAQGVDLEIGSGQFIPGFEDGLIGANIGDTVSINLNFPEVYQNNPDLAGKPVVFNVTINSIAAAMVPELTDEYVKEFTEYDSVQAFKDATKQQLQEISDENYEADLMNVVLNKLIEEATFSSIPQSLLDFHADTYRNFMEQQVMLTYGVTLDEYLEYLGMTRDDFEQVVSRFAEGQAKAELVEKAIADSEKIKISEKDYKEMLPQYMSDRGVSTEENLRKNETKEQTKENMRRIKAMDLVIDQAVVTENKVNAADLNN